MKKYKMKNLFITTTFLDPRFKKFRRFVAKEGAEYLKKAKKFIKDFVLKNEMADINLSDCENEPEIDKTNRLHLFDFEVEEKLQCNEKHSLNKELNDYTSEQVNIDVLKYWKLNQKNFQY